MNIILASESRYKKSLLERLQINFTSIAPNINEQKRQDETIKQMVIRLAQQKAEKIAATHPDSLVIAADQAADYQGQVIGKPNNIENARRQLERYSGKKLTFYTGICVINTQTSVIEQALSEYTVGFRKLTSEAIHNYLNKEQAYDCAAGLKIEGLGISLISEVCGDDPTALIGLPLIKLCAILRRMNVPI